MRCMFLYRDADGRLPTARELRLRGFRVSAAVDSGGPDPDVPDDIGARGAGESAGGLLAERALCAGPEPEPQSPGQ